MNTKITINQNSFGATSWRSCLRLLLALVLLGLGATVKAQNSDVWTNGLGNNNWSGTNNWIVNGNPALGLTTNAGDNLTFPQIGSAFPTYHSTNDFPTNLVTIGSMTFNTNGYVLGGNALFITNGIVDNFGSNFINVGLTMLNSQTFQNTVDPTGQTNTQTTITLPVSLGDGNNTLTIAGGGKFYLRGTGNTSASILNSGTNGGGMLLVNASGNGIAMFGPPSSSIANAFGSNTVVTINLTTNVYYATNLFNFTNVVIFATNGVNTNVVYNPLTNSINAYGNGYSYVASNTVNTFQTNSHFQVQDVVRVDGGTLQIFNALSIPSGALVGNVSVDGTLDLNGLSPTINGLEDQNTGAGIVDNISNTLTGTYTLTVGNASSNGIFSGIIRNSSGTVALTKTGYGTEVLMNGNQYSGQTTISQGILMLSNNPVTFTGGSLGSGSTILTIGSGAVFDVSALNGNSPPGYSPQAGPLTVNAGTPTKPYTNFYGSYFPFSPATTNFVVSISSTNTLVTSVISNSYDSGGVFISAVTNFTTNYTTIVYATNSIVSIINYDVIGDFNVNGGGAISPITSVSPGIATWSIDGDLSIDLSRTGGGAPNRVNFLLNNTTTPGGGTNDLIDVTGKLFIGDQLDVAITPKTGTLVSGGGQKYTLFKASGGYTASSNPLNETPAAAVINPIAPRGITATISSDANNVYLAASGTATPGQIIWRGTPSARDWDIKLTQNWVLSPSLSADYYYSGDNVIFDDTGSATNVNLPIVEAPSSMTFNNNKTNYNFVPNAGTFITGSGGITLNGSGSVTLNNPNSFTGDITINNGTLVIGNYGAYGNVIIYDGVAPGQLIFGGNGVNQVFEINAALNSVLSFANFAGITLNPGANAQIFYPGRGSSDTPWTTIGANVTRNVGSSLYMNVALRAATAQTGVYFTNTIPWTNGLLGGGWIHTGSDWLAAATNYPGNSPADGTYNYTGYSNNAALAYWLPTNNMSVNASSMAVTAGATINTLRLVGPSTVTISSGQTLTNATGGLLVSSGGAGASTISGGTLMGAQNADLIILQNYLASPLYIGSVIADNTNGAATQGSALTLGGAGGTTILTNNATYTGPTYINGSTLQVGAGAPLGSIATSSAIYDNGTLSFNRPDAVSLNAVSGFGSLTQLGTGALTLTANNTLSGLVTISAGILQLGTGGAAGSVSNASGVVDNGTLVINNSGTSGYVNPISGTGGLVQFGTGTFVIATNETYSGNTVVSNGTIKLMPSSSISNTAAIIVNAGAVLNIDPGTIILRSGAPAEILAGSGTIMGSITTAGNTKVTPGTNGVVGTLNITNNLTLSGGSFVFDVGTNSHDKILVGNLTQNSGNVVLNVLNPLTNGIYQLIYATNGLNATLASSLSLVGFGQIGQLASLTNNTPNELDLRVVTGVNPGVTWHGDGVNNYWDTSALNWKDGGGNPAQFANFDYATFDDSGSNNTPVNLQIVVMSSGITNNSTQNYTFGVAGGSGANRISGGSTLTKSGSGILTLQTTNDYVGATTINAGGTIQLGDNTAATEDGTLGNGNVVNNGTLIANNFANETIPGNITGSGLLVQQGVGKLTLTGDNSVSTGPVTLTNTLQVGNNISGNLGTGNVTNNGTLLFDVGGSVTVSANISGNGSVSNIPGMTGIVTLTGTNTYTGATAVNGGELEAGSTNAIPSTTSLIINDNNNGASSVGIFDLNGRDVTVASLSGNNTGNNTAGLVEGLVINHGATTNNLIINGGTTNTYNGQILDSATLPGNMGLVIIGGQLTLVASVNAVPTYPLPNTFGGGITVSNAGLALGTGQGSNTGPTAGGTDAIGGNPLGTQNVTFTGTNDNFFAAGSGGSTGPTLNSQFGTMTVTTNTSVWIFGPQRGALSASALVGSGTIHYTYNYVRDRLTFGVATNFTGTIYFGQHGTTGAGDMGYNGSVGFPNANIIFDTNNVSTWRFYESTTVSATSLQFGSLAGGDNTANLAGSSGNSGFNTVYCIGNLNSNTIFGGQVFDGIGIRQVGSGSLTLTNNVLSWSGQTVVSNGTLAFVPLGNNPDGFNALTNNYLVCSNITIVNPGILDVSKAGGTLWLISSARAQTLYGSGELTNNLVVSNSIVAPGRRASTVGMFPSSLRVDGTATFTNMSTIQMSVSTNTPVGYDNLNVIGALNIHSGLGQAALVVVTNGPIPFPPMSTNVFRFFSNSVSVALGANSGGITNITVQTNLPPGMFWRTNLDGTLAGYPTIPAGAMAIINSNNPTSVLLLQGLVVTPAGVLTPAFTSNTFSYTAVEAYLNGSVTVTPTDYDTTVSNRVIYLGVTNGVISGSPSTSMTLDANPNKNNVVVISVTGQDGVSVTNYTVTVIRHPDLTPGAIVNSFNNGTMTLSWPLSENGYQLQAQTNALVTGLSNNWTVVSGSTLTNVYTNIVDPSQPSVFYRLINTNSP